MTQKQFFVISAKGGNDCSGNFFDSLDDAKDCAFRQAEKSYAPSIEYSIYERRFTTITTPAKAKLEVTK